MKQVVKRIVKWGCLVLLILGVGIIALLMMLFAALDTPEFRCADDGKVWDSDEQRCRDDCHWWIPGRGCIRMSETYYELFQACKKDRKKCDWKKIELAYREDCFNNNGVLNLQNFMCDFAFEKKDCFKLEGAWAYPPICGEKGSEVDEAVPVFGAGG